VIHLKKTLEAKDVGLLKHMLAMEMKRLTKQADVDIVMFLGVDGRMFSSFVPTKLNMRQYNMLSLVKGNLPDICSQLRRENIKMSMVQYDAGSLYISGVGSAAFLIAVDAKEISNKEIQEKLGILQNTSLVVKHIYELKPLTEEGLKDYPTEVKVELETLGRQLFKERYTQTKDYKKNVDTLEIIKDKLATIVGKGAVQEIMDMTFNEMGLRLSNMDKATWMIFLDTVIKKHITRLSGPIVADECLRTWVPEIEMKLRSFV
jgi:predicted regulator of Ras-like GTPase activity (Roadblock/LC7/MglB family)